MTRQHPTVRAATPLRRRNRLVQSSAHLVRPVALHYSRCTGECSDDLLQVGQLGLIRAAELYEGSREIPFEAFARPHIRGAILHHLRDVAPLVRLPRRQAELRDRIGRIQADGSGTAADLQNLGISAETWHLLRRHREMNRPLPLEPELLDTVPEAGGEAIESDATLPHGPEAAAVVDLLERLDPRQQQVVREVVLAGQSFRQVGAQLRISPVTAKKLLQAGLDALRHELASLPAAGG